VRHVRVSVFCVCVANADVSPFEVNKFVFCVLDFAAHILLSLHENDYLRTCQEMSGNVRICQDMSGYVRICQEMSGYVRNC